MLQVVIMDDCQYTAKAFITIQIDRKTLAVCVSQFFTQSQIQCRCHQ